MKFLKTIQKSGSERPAEPENIVYSRSETAAFAGNEPAGMLAMPDLRIGAPRSAERGTPDESRNGTKPHENGRPHQSMPLDRTPTVESPLIPEIFLNLENVNPRLVSITQPRSPYCEEYRNLRTQILHKSKKRKLQAIVVASVGSSEGKSVTALNLSWLFAQTDGLRALVVDSDLRRPAMAGYLGFDCRLGLADVLTGGASLMEAVVRLRPSGLYMLPGGEARTDVAELISGPRFSEILNEARSHFDFIIIDAPPLGIFTDASLLINQADGAMLVIKAGHTKYKDVDRILESLPRERMLGTILNQSETPLMDESHYNYGLYERIEPAKV